MRFSDHFRRDRQHRPDRSDITIEMCERVVAAPLEVDSEGQPKARTAYWGYFEESDRYLKVVVEPDGETIWTAHWDRKKKREMRRKEQG